MSEKLRYDGKIMGAVISRTADQWFVSIQVEMPDPQPIHHSQPLVIGVDLGIKDLNVSGMAKNHCLARSVLDMSFFEFRRQLTYKAKMTGSAVVVADRFFPSSKKCSHCGEKYAELDLSVRQWDCPACQTHHDRDVNAAINLRNNAVSYTVSACGELVGSHLVEAGTQHHT